MHKKFLFLSIAVTFVLSASALTFAQPAAAAPPSKIVIVNTNAFFDEKAGVNRIVTARKQVAAELAPERTKVTALLSRVQVLENEIARLQENAQKNIPIDQNAAQAKVVELERLKREGKYKGDEFNALVEKRQNEVVGPQFSAALKALGDYIKSKGYGIVFDISKDQTGFLVFATEQYDITKDFIAFYNSRPATAATAAAPR